MPPCNFSALEEAYSSAANASDLRFCVRESSPHAPADVLVAAGWSRSHIGGSLLRLRAEHDAAARKADGGRAPERVCRPARLRALPEVHGQLAAQAARWSMDSPEIVSAAVLRWWLQPACSRCLGRKFQPLPGTDRLSPRKCVACNATGLSSVPHGEPGRRLASFIDDCVQSALQSMHSVLGGRDA
ncbi:hypothetical protein [Paracidovorax citrulli]|nr:hypothetical protein [Paracidovorax citrulli]ATG96868.1 hypothetical protein CQB05_06045 [Paracidovorax citrulli]QCX09573.1 hypothetical protein APS58_0631 [Paracidovorax citrulli]UMT86292.1 hypothetical protein FRC75_02690 [Paracidovorax citrulli]UMT90739.1 hypothetical protein FRC90_15270 [Paracidovorax citrulli]UMT97712.1 hypothetical protein FRC97_13810 [Paracidovorax citrulli]